ncbi:MAG: hypothetical protein WCK35_20120 [Chloroflexota bacterium]
MPHSKVVSIQAAMPGTHSGDHDWYPYGRLRVVPIQPIKPGTHMAAMGGTY